MFQPFNFATMPWETDTSLSQLFPQYMKEPDRRGGYERQQMGWAPTGAPGGMLGYMPFDELPIDDNTGQEVRVPGHNAGVGIPRYGPKRAVIKDYVNQNYDTHSAENPLLNALAGRHE